MTELIITIAEWIASNLVGLVSFLAVIFSGYKYFDNKKRELNQEEFKNFHRLIKELVEPDKRGRINVS